MEKLTLEHLAPYLPYELIMYYTGEHQKQFKGTKKREVLTIENYQLLTFSTQRKPILRPLSDLTKEIDINGEKFIPQKRLLGIFKDLVGEAYNESLHTKRFAEITEVLELPQLEQYWIVQTFIKWHFDVFGLIEKGLAIDINTLK